MVGPESTGKSTLSQQLVQHYNCALVPEFARDYIGKLKRKYTLEDIAFIAKEQLQLEKQAQGKMLICDTNLLVTKIWAEHAFRSCPKFISDNWNPADYDLHLLMNIDLPWEADPQREHPNLRTFFFDWYKRELIESKVNFSIISGNSFERQSAAIKVIDAFLK